MQYCDIKIDAIQTLNNFILYFWFIISAPMTIKIGRLFLSVVDHKLNTYKTIALKNTSPADLQTYCDAHCRVSMPIMIMSERTEYMFNIEIEHVTTQVLITLNLLFLSILIFY